MDFFNFAKAVEQGIYDVMMWIFFYPYTLVRMLLFPSTTLRYVWAEAQKDNEDAFLDAMRPALMLFISIVLGTVLAPLSDAQRAILQENHFGQLVASSWFFLVFFRMVIFAIFPLTGAVLLDLLTPGRISRTTLRTPFYLQCYACAPLALVASPALVNLQSDSLLVFALVAAAIIWFVGVQFVFFRDYARQDRLRSAFLAPGVLVIGTIGALAIEMILIS